jgi:hypothetical protein
MIAVSSSYEDSRRYVVYQSKPVTGSVADVQTLLKPLVVRYCLLKEPFSRVQRKDVLLCQRKPYVWTLYEVYTGSWTIECVAYLVVPMRFSLDSSLLWVYVLLDSYCRAMEALGQ